MSCCPTLFSESYSPTYLVAPFWSNIDTSVAGNVSYRVITSGTSASLVKSVSDYVSRKMNTTFSGKWMIVAEWRHVHKFQAREPVLVRVGGVSRIVGFDHKTHSGRIHNTLFDKYLSLHCARSKE